MAKTVAPLLSFDAGGQIAKTQVYSRWKGRPYVRRYVIPANPNTIEQQKTRSAFKWLMEAWKFYPAGAQAGWGAYADSLRITDRNAWAKINLSPLRNATDLADLIVSPSALSGIVAADMAVTPGNDALTIELTAPTLPAGWAVVMGCAVAVPNQDPNTDQDYRIVYGQDVSDPYSITLTALKSAIEYLVGGWFVYTKADGTTAYGQSLQELATTT